MRTTSLSVALEAIEFQENKLFKELTEHIQALHGFGTGMSNRDYWAESSVRELSKIIKRHTNITIDFTATDSIWPSIVVPLVDGKHPLMQPWIKDLIMQGYRIDMAADTRRVMKTMETDVLRGTVDIAKAKVSGFYEQLRFNIYMHRSYLEGDSLTNAEETAAIILHEVGHVFTWMEFAGRAFTTNQVLAGMLVGMDKRVGADQKTMIFAKGAQLLRMNKEQRDAVINAKNEAEVTCIVLDAAVSQSRTELGLNIFDHTGSEQLADQFATRMGAGKAMIYGLEKLEKIANPPFFSMAGMLQGIVTALTIIFTVIALNFFLVFGVLINVLVVPSYEVPMHNTTKGRYVRILNEYGTRLTDRNLLPEDRKAVLVEYEQIKKIVERLDMDLGTFDKISYFVSGSFRKARKFHLLQVELESLAANDLFAKAAKFSLL